MWTENICMIYKCLADTIHHLLTPEQGAGEVGCVLARTAP